MAPGDLCTQVQDLQIGNPAINQQFRSNDET